MTRSTVGWRLAASLVVALLAALGAAACASSQQPKTEWPTAGVVPSSAPEDLDTEAATSLLRRSSNGFLYAVGGLPDDASPGTPFLARYSGDWPLEEISRPPLAAGRIVRRVGEGAALVHLTYRMPESEIEGLELSWEKSVYAESVGKGLGQVERVDGESPATATVTIGRRSGVQPGDVYAVLSPRSTIDSPIRTQLSHRYEGICVVDRAAKSSAKCRLAGPAGSVERGDGLLFLEHVRQKPPREGIVQVGALAGASSDAAQSARGTLTDALESFARKRSEDRVRIESIDRALEATRDDFHRVADAVEYSGRPQVAVGVEAVPRKDGPAHLVVNYTGVGPTTGPGMVAAPPTGGVDLGRVDRLDAEDFRGFVSVVWTGMYVYRGQTARALHFLHRRLSGDLLQGPLRWHSRDQYAMRWGALGHYEEALWLVLQDRAIARKQYGRAARLNAEGTLVRLYDFVGLGDRAADAAVEYLAAQREKKPGPEWLAAIGMAAELQAAAGRIEASRKSLGTLREACPDGCGGDLFSYLSSVWWALPNDAHEAYRADLLDDLVAIGVRRRGRELAAARLYQGITAMREKQFTQALIGFLEASRIYGELGMQEGVARSRYFEMLAQLQRDDYQKAFEAGQEAVELRKKLRDFEGLARAYDRLSRVYADLDFSKRPGPYLRSARSVLTNAYESHRARGSFGKAGESLYTLGSFLFKFGQNESAKVLFRKAVGFSVSATRFDIAALSHLHLAFIARRNDRQSEFRREAARARSMADLAESPRIKKMIERALDPKKNRKPERDIPTEML